MSRFFKRNWSVVGFAGLAVSIITLFVVVVQPCISCSDGVPLGAVLYDAYIRPFVKCLQ